MAAELTDDIKAILESKALAHVVTLMKDGSPQVTPLWVDHDGTHVIVNTAEGRQKPLNLRRDPRVAVSVVDPDNLYRYFQVRGKVVEMTHEGAREHIEKLSQKYVGRPYGGNPSEQRIIVKILPEHISGMRPRG